MLKCFFGCKIKWGEKLHETDMVRKGFMGGVEISATPYVQSFQEGRCVNCGKIYQRKVNIS